MNVRDVKLHAEFQDLKNDQFDMSTGKPSGAAARFATNVPQAVDDRVVLAFTRTAAALDANRSLAGKLRDQKD